MVNNTPNAIGSLDWDACADCIHSDPDEGGCNVGDAKWAAKILVEGDYVYCGSREQRKDDEENQP